MNDFQLLPAAIFRKKGGSPGDGIESRSQKQMGLMSDWLIDCLVPRFLLRARDRKIINKTGGRRQGEFSRFV